MSKIFVFKNALLLAEGEKIQDPFIEVENQHIKRFGKSSHIVNEKVTEYFQFDEPVFVTPGFIDIHIHGAANGDVMDGKVESLNAIKKALPEEGTTSFLATTLTQARSEKIKALSAIKEMKETGENGGAQILGIHLEGPFISPKQAGAQPFQYIEKPNVDWFKEFYEASGNSIKLVTLAPEEENGLELVRVLKEMGVTGSIGHSNASYEEVLRSVEAGVTQCTHLFNGMRGAHHRDLGVAGAVMLHEELKAELIVDGIHVSAPMVKLVYKNKGVDGIILITDSMRAKGMSPGNYLLGGQNVVVNEDRALLADGRLAGSILKMNEAVRNMMTFAGCSIEEAVQMATINPAKQIKMDHHKGSIRVGKDADFIIIDEHCNVKNTFILGEKVF